MRALGGDIRLIELERRTGKAENDSTLLREASGRYCLLLNEDSELRPGAAAALIAALDADPKAAAAGAAAARLRRRPGPLRLALPRRRHRAGRRPLPAPPAHRAEQGRARPAGSTGRSRAPCWSAARRPPRSATSTPTSSSTTTSATSAKRLADAGWHTLFVPAAEAVHHDQLSTDLAAGLPRIVEFHRNRDLYMRKHHWPRGGAARCACSPPGPTPCAPSPPPSSPASPAAHLPGPRPPGAASPSAARVASRDRADAKAHEPSGWRLEARVLVHAARPRRSRGSRPSTAGGRGAQRAEARRAARRGGAGGRASGAPRR